MKEKKNSMVYKRVSVALVLKQEGSAQSHKQLGARGRPRSGNDANLYAEELCYFGKKNAFTFTGTAEVRSTLQTFFNISILRISYYGDWYNEKYNFSLRI